MFGRLFTTKFVNWFSDAIDAKLFRRIRRFMRASLLAIDRYFGVDHLPAYTHEQLFSDLNKQQTNIDSFSTVEAMEKVEESEKQAEQEFNKHVFETLGDVAQVEGPLRGVLYRNTIPMLTYFIEVQSLWLIMSGMSKFKFMRSMLVGRFFHKSAVVPYSQLWKMHLSETIVNLTEIAMSLTARICGAVVGFYSTRFLVSRSDFVSSYISIADGALVGEQLLGHYLTKGFRSYASFYVHHNVNEFLSSRFPLNEELFEKEMEDLKDIFGNNDDEQQEEEEEEEEDQQNENGGQQKNENDNDDDDQQQQQDSSSSSNKKKKKAKQQPKEIGEDEFDEVSRQAIFTSENYYEHLEIEKSATQEEVRKAFRRQAILYHPDRLASKTPQEQEQGMQKFKKLQQSYEVLSNEKRRREYDFAQAQGLFESPEVASAREYQKQRSSPLPNPFSAFFGSTTGRRKNNSSSSKNKERKRNAFGEEEDEVFSEEDEYDFPDADDAYAQYQYHNQPRPSGLHPVHVVQKYFEFVDRVVGEDNIKAQQVAHGLSSATAFGMMFVVMHQHAANQYQQFLKPGV